ncbi:MAG: glycosyl transferase, partial [Pseudomonadota bacterium]
GKRAQFGGWPIAGKTGTTQSARDAWFIAFTADYVAGVWMGYDDNTPLTGVTGSGLPAEIWREVMSRVHAGQPPKALPMVIPEQVVATPQPQARTPQRRQNDRPVERLINQVLKDVFGIGRRN